ncbi:exopolysaccharide biosynthesis protein [Aidingimonas lacisalsi]|uniref:exopolysaccharide biosynthesis protein n=1 Tax=Aidingimonas lacisalsi TaxID=2604086 RepID=UPI0011D26415|nr:exopolysaccharide biosynthesis protein [Aidingimonas lacisalsi]
MDQNRSLDEQGRVASIEQLLDCLDGADHDGERTSVDDIVTAVGRRSFGPLLLLAGLITLAPLIGDIPGVPTLMAILVLLVAAQLLFGRERFWLPGWLLNRAVSRDTFDRGIRWMRKPARGIDRLLHPRLRCLTQGIGVRGIAIMCMMIALAMPPMEVVPFTANGAGLALTVFGLALIANDGLLALLGYVVTLGTLAIVIANLV